MAILELSWTYADGSDRIRIPLMPSDERRLAKKLNGSSWAQTEALLVLSEWLAGTARRYARLRCVPPSEHSIACAARVIASRRVVIPVAAVRDRDAMTRFLSQNGLGDEVSASVLLYGRPSVEMLPQHPRVMRRLKRAGYVRPTAGSNLPKDGSAVPAKPAG